jgi:hypothetical protein
VIVFGAVAFEKGVPLSPLQLLRMNLLTERYARATAFLAVGSLSAHACGVLRYGSGARLDSTVSSASTMSANENRSA